MKAELLKPTTDTELQRYHSREEVLVARGIKEVLDCLEPIGHDQQWHPINRGVPTYIRFRMKIKEWERINETPNNKRAD